VLLLDERDQWELPSRPIETGEDYQGCQTREIDEELRLQVQIVELLDTYLLRVIPGVYVFITADLCEQTGAFEPRLSHERKRMGNFAPSDLPNNLPGGDRSSIQAALAHLPYRQDTLRVARLRPLYMQALGSPTSTIEGHRCAGDSLLDSGACERFGCSIAARVSPEGCGTR
jgi:ADP-ribose pyrophosphatase YjhB (NUDIX family)